MLPTPFPVTCGHKSTPTFCLNTLLSLQDPFYHPHQKVQDCVLCTQFHWLLGPSIVFRLLKTWVPFCLELISYTFRLPPKPILDTVVLKFLESSTLFRLMNAVDRAPPKYAKPHTVLQTISVTVCSPQNMPAGPSEEPLFYEFFFGAISKLFWMRHWG